MMTLRLRKVLRITDKKTSFHSFQHTVANRLKQKGVAESYIGELLGHSSGSLTLGGPKRITRLPLTKPKSRIKLT